MQIIAEITVVALVIIVAAPLVWVGALIVSRLRMGDGR